MLAVEAALWVEMPPAGGSLTAAKVAQSNSSGPAATAATTAAAPPGDKSDVSSVPVRGWRTSVSALQHYLYGC